MRKFEEELRKEGRGDKEEGRDIDSASATQKQKKHYLEVKRLMDVQILKIGVISKKDLEEMQDWKRAEDEAIQKK